MTHPEEVLSVAKRIGELLRTTGWVKKKKKEEVKVLLDKILISQYLKVQELK